MDYAAHAAAAAPPADTPVKREPRDVVRPASAAKDASSLYGLEYLDLDHKPFLLSAPSSQSWAAVDDRHEMMISFPAAASTSGVRPRVPPGRKHGIRSSTPRPKIRYVYAPTKLICAPGPIAYAARFGSEKLAAC